MTKTLVGVVILHWNGAADTIECLASLSLVNDVDLKIIVVDNGSTDGSAAQIKERFGDRVDLLLLPQNLGFARGNNAGIRYACEQARPEYLIVMNNDVTVTPDFARPLLAALASDPAAALAAPMILDLPRKIFWQRPIVQRFNLLTYLCWATPLYRWTSRFIRLDLRQSSRVYAVPGSCFCFRRNHLEKIDFFDERTFLGSEEYIIAEKLRQTGLGTVFVPASVVYHRVGRATDKLAAAVKAAAFLRSERYCLIEYFRFSFPARLLIRAWRSILYAGQLLPRGELKEWLKIVGGVPV
ncbi:MAG: glycosyltransferase family 2 protein [Candidatus Margulisbacteria bacterium]|jgi:hypothetical protein|nr:glycosyltransferase family 2 protein [Candidatus Margulisiibacteriota bacterium]